MCLHEIDVSICNQEERTQWYDIGEIGTISKATGISGAEGRVNGPVDLLHDNLRLQSMRHFWIGTNECHILHLSALLDERIASNE